MNEQSELTRSRVGAAWLFLAPMLFLLLLVAGWPLLRDDLVRLHRRDLSDLTQWKFVGIAKLPGQRGRQVGRAAGPIREVVARGLEYDLLRGHLGQPGGRCLGMIIALVLNASFPGRALCARRC